jgi:hypothetical protein
MENQTDGVEWVLGVLFGLGLVAVLAAAFREFTSLRKRSGPSESTPSPPSSSPTTPPEDDPDA